MSAVDDRARELEREITKLERSGWRLVSRDGASAVLARKRLLFGEKRQRVTVTEHGTVLARDVAQPEEG